MSRSAPRSLTTKIILESLVLLTCLFAVLVGGGAAYQREIVREMEAKSGQILRGLQVQIGQEAATSLDDVLLGLREQEDVDAIVLFDEQQQFTASARSARLADAAIGAPGQGLQIHNLQGPQGPLTAYVQTMPIEAADGRLMGYVNVALAVEPQAAVLRAFQSRLLLALATVFCIATAALCYTVVSALRPLRQLSDHLAAVGEGELAKVSVTANSSEVSILQERFNHMVESLEEKGRMADRLRQTQRLSAMGNLAAGVAHDIGNPLNSLQLTASHLSDILKDNDPARLPDAARYAATIHGEVKRLDRLVQNFLALAREQEPDTASQDPDALMRDVLGLVRAEARRREIELSAQLDAGGARVALDAGQVKGAIINMLVNAFDAAGPGGRVEVRTARRNGAVDIAIRDTGPGIPQDIQARMFEPYFTTKPDGTGLGLALSRTVVEQHGGTLAVDCPPEGGATFTISFKAEATDV